MSDDLKKLMGKLKAEKKKKVEETPTQDPNEDIEIEATADDTPSKDVTEKKTELKEVEDQEEDIAGELAVLQNDGIFRRELLLTLRELIDVHKVNTQTLLDLKNDVRGALNGKKQ